MLLLSRNIKKRIDRLARVAAFILIMRFVDMIWLITPAHSPRQLHIHLFDLISLIGIGGIWLTLFLWALSRKPLVAYNSPRLKQILDNDGDGHHG